MMLKNTAKQPGTQVFNLRHEQFCAEGPCACTNTTLPLAVETDDGKTGVQIIDRRICASLTIPPGATVEADPRVEKVRDVQAALARGDLRKVG